MQGLISEISDDILSKPLETSLMMIPCFLYFVQNNLLLLAVANLDPPVYYVVSQVITMFIVCYYPDAYANVTVCYYPDAYANLFHNHPISVPVTYLVLLGLLEREKRTVYSNWISRSQLKILPTALFSILILNKTICSRKWIALLILIGGTVTSQGNLDSIGTINALGK